MFFVSDDVNDVGVKSMYSEKLIPYIAIGNHFHYTMCLNDDSYFDGQCSTSCTISVQFTDSEFHRMDEIETTQIMLVWRAHVGHCLSIVNNPGCGIANRDYDLLPPTS